MMLVGEFLFCIVCMFVHRFSEGGWWGRVRRSVLVVVSCFVFALCTYVLECIVMYFPSLIKLVMAFILHVIISRIYGIEGWFLMFELPI